MIEIIVKTHYDDVPYDIDTGKQCEQIVRCHDCRYFELPEDSRLNPYCTCLFEGTVIPPNVDRLVKPDGFCAWGKPELSEKEIDDIYNILPWDIKELVECGLYSKREVCCSFPDERNNNQPNITDYSGNDVQQVGCCGSCFDCQYRNSRSCWLYGL